MKISSLFRFFEEDDLKSTPLVEEDATGGRLNLLVKSSGSFVTESNFNLDRTILVFLYVI